MRNGSSGGQKIPTVAAGWASLTWVSVHVQVFGASEGESKAGGNLPGSPLASDHLRRLLPEPIGVSVVDVDQTLLVLSPERTADGHICQTAERKLQLKQRNLGNTLTYIFCHESKILQKNWNQCSKRSKILAN